MGISPTYSLIGNNGLRDFFHSPQDETKMREELTHQGALPPQFTVSHPVHPNILLFFLFFSTKNHKIPLCNCKSYF